LYCKELAVGPIRSTIQLNDVKLQIRREKLSGYELVWKKSDGEVEVIGIDEFGILSKKPKGFFDILDDQLDELIGLDKL
jgi:hypothetical protein